MKKKLMFLLIIPMALFVMHSSAVATPYAVLFDASGGSGPAVQEQIYGWDMEAFPIFNPAFGYPVDIVTYQSLGPDNVLGDGDTFTESFVLNVENGLTSWGQALWAGISGVGGYYNAENAYLFADITLSGYITNYDDGGTPTTAANVATSILDDSYWSIFDAGGGTMYVNTGGFGAIGYDPVVDIAVATFEFFNADPVILTPSVFTGAGAQVNVGFKFTWLDPDFFAPAPGYANPFDLVGKGWFLSYNQGGIAVTGFVGDESTDPHQILIAVQETGFDARFEAIPEPTTMLLLGAGLLGLAGLGRKRFFKKV